MSNKSLPTATERTMQESALRFLGANSRMADKERGTAAHAFRESAFMDFYAHQAAASTNKRQHMVVDSQQPQHHLGSLTKDKPNVAIQATPVRRTKFMRRCSVTEYSLRATARLALQQLKDELLLPIQRDVPLQNHCIDSEFESWEMPHASAAPTNPNTHHSQATEVEERGVGQTARNDTHRIILSQVLEGTDRNLTTGSSTKRSFSCCCNQSGFLQSGKRRKLSLIPIGNDASN